MHKLIYLIPVLLFMVSACVDDNCDSIVIGESFTISDSTEIHLSNYFDSDRVVFLNSQTSEEVIFDISEKIISAIEYELTIECPENAVKTSPLMGTSEYKQIQISNTSLDITITLQHQAALTIASPGAIEQLFVVQGALNELNQIQSSEHGLLVVTPGLNENLFTIKTPMLSIAGIDFLDVETINPLNKGFENDFLSENIEVAYTKDEGLVLIRDILSNLELVYDRTE